MSLSLQSPPLIPPCHFLAASSWPSGGPTPEQLSHLLLAQSAHLLGDMGDPVAESLGVMAQKLWLLPSFPPETHLGALPELQSLPPSGFVT